MYIYATCVVSSMCNFFDQTTFQFRTKEVLPLSPPVTPHGLKSYIHVNHFHLGREYDGNPVTVMKIGSGRCLFEIGAWKISLQGFVTYFVKR